MSETKKRPDFRVAYPTGRTDAKGKATWRDSGVAFRHEKGAGLSVLADTIFGNLRFCLFPAPSPQPLKAPDMRAVTDTGREWTDPETGEIHTEWHECGVAWMNASGGYNVQIDTPLGQPLKLCLFPLEAAAPAAAGAEAA